MTYQPERPPADELVISVLLMLLVCLLWFRACEGGVHVVQTSNIIWYGSGYATFSSPVTAGDMIVASFTYISHDIDSVKTKHTKLTKNVNAHPIDATNGMYCLISDTVETVTGMDTVFFWTSSPDGYLYIYDVSPCKYAQAISAATTGANLNAGSITTSSDSCAAFYVSLQSDGSGSGCVTVPVGWTGGTQSGGPYDGAMQYKIVHPAGTVNGVETTTGGCSGSHPYVSAMMTFNPLASITHSHRSYFNPNRQGFGFK